MKQSLNIVPFLRNKSELTYTELKTVNRDGVCCSEILLPEYPQIIEMMKCVLPGPVDPLYTTYYITHYPGVIYLNYSFDEMFNSFLAQIIREGKMYFVSELKQKYPTLFRLLYNSMIYHKTQSNSEKGVCYRDEEGKLIFMKSFPIGMKQINLAELITMIKPYVQIGHNCILEVLQNPILDGYRIEQEIKNEKQIEHFGVSLLTKAIVGFYFG